MCTPNKGGTTGTRPAPSGGGFFYGYAGERLVRSGAGFARMNTWT